MESPTVQLHNNSENISGANVDQQSAQEKAPHVVSISLAGLYSFKTRESFSLVNNKMILVGPNNSGKSNLIRAIILCLSYAPGGPSREVMEELKFFGPEMNNEPCFISLQFELDPGTIQFIADALVFPLVAQFPVTSINEEQAKKLLELRNTIKSRIKAVHLVCRELSEKNSNGEPCYESYGAITDRVVENYVPFFDEVKENAQQFMIYDSTCHSLSLATMSESLNAKLKSIVALYDGIRYQLVQILGFDPSANSTSWLNSVEKVDGLWIILEDFIERLNSSSGKDSWASDTCLDLGRPLANLLRASVAILPQDRGLISYDRHYTNIQKFTIENVVKALTNANRCGSTSVQYRNLKRIIAAMKEFGIILSMPISPSQACEVFVYETIAEADNETMQVEIRNLMTSSNVNAKVACKRMLAFLYLPDSDRTIEKAQKDLLNSTGGSNIPEYEKERNSVFAKLLSREIGPDMMKHRYESSYHDVNPALKEYDVIRFSTSDNPTKKLSLGALYGAAQQFLIIFTTLLMGDIGTVLLDEPETSMHASSKAFLKQLIQSSDISMIVVTHADEFISERLLQCTYHCARVRASTVVTSVFKIIEKISPQRAPIRAVSSDVRPLFFIERVLFVEGPNDARLFDALQHLVKEDYRVQHKLREFNIDLNKLSSWYAINLAGCENAPFLCHLAEKLIPWCVILDRDVFENKTAKDVKTRFKNKAIYPLIEKLHPQMRLLAEIKTIADEEPDTTVTMKENAEIERVEECEDIDEITKKEKIARIKKLYKDSLFEEKSARIMQLFDKINQIFAWKGEMEHIFLQPKDAAILLHQKCTSENKHKDVDQFILRKNTNDSLHELWSFIRFSNILDAVTLLIMHENEEFISFCRYLSDF